MPKKLKYDTSGIPYQQQFQDSRKPKVYLSTGFGGGKTYSLCMKMFWLMNVNRGCPGGILAPSFKMYKRDVVPTIREICRLNRIRFKYNKSDALWMFPDCGAMVYGFTAEDPDSIKGPNLAWMAINEVTLCSKQAFLMALSRVRLKKAALLQVAMSGTPESFNWAYEYFIEAPREDTELIYGNSRLNKHVASQYFDSLTESYDDLMQQQYVEGLFVNLSGKRAAYAFNRHRHAAEGVDKIPNLPVAVSLDFNVEPMAATFWNVIPIHYRDGRWPRALYRGFDELCISSSNTYEAADAIIDRLEKDSHGRIIDRVVIYPDPAGRARSTKSRNFSDFDILKQKFGSLNYDTTGLLKFKPQVSVRDCLNATNGVLSRDELVLNVKKCRQTIADMEQCVLKDTAFEIDKSNLARSHWLDGTKNMLDFLSPVKRQGYTGERRMR